MELVVLDPCNTTMDMPLIKAIWLTLSPPAVLERPKKGQGPSAVCA